MEAKKYTIEDLKENFFIGRNVLKRLILRERVIDYVCTECGIVDTWNDKKIILELDHVNGDRSDNRIENLR